MIQKNRNSTIQQFNNLQEDYEDARECQDLNIQENENAHHLRNRQTIQPPARFRNPNYVACSAIICEPQSFEEAIASEESLDDGSNQWKRKWLL